MRVLTDPMRQLYQCYLDGVAEVAGDRAVLARAEVLRRWQPQHVLAIGKAACAMVNGVASIEGLSIRSGLVVSAPAYQSTLADARFTFVAGNHPHPGLQSLQAGQAVLDYLQTIPSGERLLVLLSGGGSSLCEVLRPGYSLAQLQMLNRWLLASGLSIAQMNRLRARISAIKQGGLQVAAAHLTTRVLYISDVQGDDPAVVASGPFYCANSVAAAETPEPELPAEFGWLPRQNPECAGQKVVHECIASLPLAMQAVARSASRQGLAVEVHQQAFLDQDVIRVANFLSDQLVRLSPGLHVFGGEPVVSLPDQAGRGGRNQLLALLLARYLARHLAGQRLRASVLCGATDGVDGSSQSAGAIVDAETVQQARALGLDPARYIDSASSADLFDRLGLALPAFASGTNVMDLVLIYLE